MRGYCPTEELERARHKKISDAQNDAYWRAVHRKKVCRNGHSYDDDRTTGIDCNGHQFCKICALKKLQAYRARKRQIELK